jgi:hypothetical protein
MRSLRLNSLDCQMQLTLVASSRDDPIDIDTPYIVELERNRNRAQTERKERMLLDLRVIALDVAARDGPLKLREKDIERMYEIVQTAFVELYPDRR